MVESNLRRLQQHISYCRTQPSVVVFNSAVMLEWAIILELEFLVFFRPLRCILCLSFSFFLKIKKVLLSFSSQKKNVKLWKRESS